MRTFCNCFRCNFPILEGDHFFTISKELSKSIYNKTIKAFEIDVDESEEIMTLCIGCYEKFNIQILVFTNENYQINPNKN